MSTAQNGNRVKVHYTGTLQDGTPFDSSVGRDPLEFTIGEGGLIPAFEQAVIGMSSGDTKSIDIPATEAYGERSDELVHDVPREVISGDVELEVGMALQAQGPDGQLINLSVVSFDNESVTVDANHPLAGHDLTFAIEMIEIAA
jgi:FKBP-type peptidyl-prolyl cis-trans isomerase 2